jgi:hypothetical protein
MTLIGGAVLQPVSPMKIIKIIIGLCRHAIYIDVTRIFYIFFHFNLQIYTTVLKFIKTIYQPPWRSAVSRSRRTPRRLPWYRRRP